MVNKRWSWQRPQQYGRTSPRRLPVKFMKCCKTKTYATMNFKKWESCEWKARKQLKYENWRGALLFFLSFHLFLWPCLFINRRYIYTRVGSRFMWSQIVLIKVVHFCIKMIVKLIRPKFDIHRCVFLGRAHRARSPASLAERTARARARGPVGWGTSKVKKWYLCMSNFGLTNFTMIFMQ